MISFTFDGKDSFKDFGIIVTKRPNIPTPKRRVSFIDIPGRDSALRFDEGTFEDINIFVECTIKNKGAIQIVDDIRNWLVLAKEKDLIFSFQNMYKYRAQVINAIDFEQVFKQMNKFAIVFTCRPFKYFAQDENLIISQDKGLMIKSKALLPSKPIIKVFLNGENGSLKIKNREVVITGAKADMIILDCELEETYYLEGTKVVNASPMVKGAYPLIEFGENSTSFTGSVTKLEINPNSRWL